MILGPRRCNTTRFHRDLNDMTVKLGIDLPVWITYFGHRPTSDNMLTLQSQMCYNVSMI